MNHQKPAGVQNISIDHTQLQLYSCPHCLNTVFLDAVEIKILPLVISPTGRKEIIKIPVIICAICRKKINLNDIKEEKKNAILR